MYFLDALGVLVRRWYFVLLGTSVVVVGAMAVLSWTPASYQASGQVLLILPAEASGESTPTNPYLNLPDELTATASLVAAELASPDTARALADDGFDSQYAVALLPETGPLLSITAEDTDPRAAIRTRNEVMRRVGVRLERMQAGLGIPERLLISAMPTNVSAHAELLRGSKIRALAAVVGAGMTTTLVLTFALDRLLGRRRRHAEVERTEDGFDVPSTIALEPPRAESAPPPAARAAGRKRASHREKGEADQRHGAPSGAHR